MLGHPTAAQLEHRRADRHLFRAAVRRSSVATALSTASADAVASLFGRPAEVLPPGVRIDRFPLEDRPRTGPPQVLFSSQLDDRRKGLALLLAAFALVLGEEPEARLLLAGAGDPSWALASLGDQRATVEAAVDHVG